MNDRVIQMKQLHTDRMWNGAVCAYNLLQLGIAKGTSDLGCWWMSGTIRAQTVLYFTASALQFNCRGVSNDT